MSVRTSRNIAKILKVPLISTSELSVLRKILDLIDSEAKGKTIFTPNAEFLVAAYYSPEFRQVLNQADINVPDGFGLILLSGLVGQKIKKRISGADLVENLLKIAEEKKWPVGVVGVRRGDPKESKLLLSRLQKKYPGLKIVNLDNQKVSKSQGLKIVFACQGMKKQEQWILANKDKIKANVFIGVGGSLDFLTGFTKRAPYWLRTLGLEWFWRGLQKPGHWLRIWRAVVVFPILVLKERLKRNLNFTN